jgi:Ca2+-transporting ATPase
MAVTVLSLVDREIEIRGTGYEPMGKFQEGGKELSAGQDTQVREALTIAVLANHAALVEDDGDVAVLGDPTEAALLVAGARAGLNRNRLIEEHPQVGEVPFSSTRMLMATFHRADGGAAVCVKGAPGRVIERCDRTLTASGDVPLDDGVRERLLERNRDLAARGLRVLALARGRSEQTDEAALQHLTFVGFAGLIDPPARGVMETIRLFRDAGIHTVMLTGDQQNTAQAVAKDLGILREGDEVLDGRMMAQLSNSDLAARITNVAAFSRVDPEAKLAIVRAFQHRGDIVAVLGDGVNDAPALRQADVGVAMGQRGTDVAKEAADVVLLDDRFSTIGVAVEQGRVIFDNIRKFVFYLFSCNLAEVLVLLVATLVGLPLPLLPLQILWLNIVTDTFPALSLAIEPADRDVMRRRPREPDEAIFSAGFVRAMTFYGVLITGVTLAAFWIALEPNDGTASARASTMSFMTLALAQTFHLGNARSEEHVLTIGQALANPVAVGAVVLVVFLQVLAVHFPPFAETLHTEPLAARDWLVCLSLALVPAVVGQAVRWWSATQA